MSQQSNIESNKRFKKFRQEVFITQGAAAEFLNVKQALISKIENGGRILHPDHLKKLVKEKSLNPDWYHNGNGKMLLSEADKKKSLLTNLEDIQLDIDLIKKEMQALRSSYRIVIQELQKIKDSQ